MWETWLSSRCGGKLLLRSIAPATVFVQFLNAFKLPGLGAEGSTSFASFLAGPWESVVVIVSLPAHLMQRCAAETSASVQFIGSTVHSLLPFPSGWTHLFVPVAWHWKFEGDSLPAAPSSFP